MTRAGDEEHQPGGQLIPFPDRRPPAGGELEAVQETELVDLETPAGGAGGPGDSSGTSLEPAGRVYDAELVNEDEAPARPTVKAVARRIASPVKAVAHHEPTVVTTKAVVRQAAYVLTGLAVVLKKWYDRRSGAIYHRQMLAAEAKGDQEGLREWEARAEQHTERRHRRSMDRLDYPKKLTRSLLSAAGFAALLLFLAGLVYGWASGDITVVLDPLFGTVRAVVWLATAVVWLAAWLGFLAAALVLGGLWQVGRKHGALPQWVAPRSTADSRDDVPITPSIVVTAFRDLGLSELRKAIVKMGDAGAGMLGPITMAGCGVEVDVALPSGSSTQEVQQRRRKLAENLFRHEHEVFITIPPQPRTVRLWIADPGALDEPIGPSPLVMDEDMTADLFTGQAPWGQDLRGDRAALLLLMRHLLITGLSNQGKTAALRALVLWLVLDPSVELRIADLKGVGDWRMFDQLATTLIQGPTDEHVIAATEMLEEGVREMERRIAALEASGATDGVTRQMAKSKQGFHPLFLLVDEAQVAFMCPAKDDAGAPYGGTKASSRYFMAARKLHNQGRVVLVHLWQGTQDPTDQNLPKLVREGAHIRAALVLGTEQQSRMALGDKAVNGGAAPHKLRQGLDKGTLVVAGDGVPLPPGQASITIRTHFIDGATATELAQRAVARRGPVRAPVAEIGPADRDLLADVAEVIGNGSDPIRAADVPALLTHAFPDWVPYRQLTGKELVRLLAELGVKVPSTGNRWPLDPATVREALAQRTES